MQPTTGRFLDLTLDEFITKLASSEPVPGGGSASAVAAGLGAGLVAMVASLSMGRPKYAEHVALHELSAAEGRALARRFVEIADEDAAAYGTLSAAMKLPRETDAEREARAQAMRLAARTAAEIPLRCVEDCRALVAAAEALAGRSNVNAASDLNVAVLLGEAAARGAAANVIVNLPMVADPAVDEHMRRRVETLLAEIEALAASTRAVILAGTPRPPVHPRGEMA